MDARLGKALVTLLALVGFALLPASALGGKSLQPCGDVLKRPPTRDTGKGLPPIVIGDSIAGWAVPALNNMGFRTNTQNCRTFAGGVAALRALRERHKVPELVIMNLGTGGTLKMKQIERALRLVGSKRRLGLVTPREFKPGFGRGKRKLMREADRRFPNIVLFDWNKVSRGHDDWFHWDNLHPVRKGSIAMAIFFAMVAENEESGNGGNGGGKQPPPPPPPPPPPHPYDPYEPA